MEPKTDRRVVRGQFRRIGLLLAGLYKLLVSGVGLGGGIFLFVRLSIRFFNSLHAGMIWVCFGLAMAMVFLAVGICTTYAAGIANIREAIKTTHRANTADLPAPESLVRASLGENAPQLQQFRSLVYWPQESDADEITRDKAWVQGRQTARQLLESVWQQFHTPTSHHSNPET